MQLKILKKNVVKKKFIKVPNEYFDRYVNKDKVNPYAFMVLIFLQFKVDTFECITFSVNEILEFCGFDMTHSSNNRSWYMNVIDVLNENRNEFFVEANDIEFKNTAKERSKYYYLEFNKNYYKKSPFRKLYFKVPVEILLYKSNELFKDIKKEEMVDEPTLLMFYLYFLKNRMDWKNKYDKGASVRKYQEYFETYYKDIQADLKISYQTVRKAIVLLEKLKLIYTYAPTIYLNANKEPRYNKMFIFEYRFKDMENPYTGEVDKYSHLDEMKYCKRIKDVNANFNDKEK